MIALRDRSHLLQEEVSLRMADQTNRNLQVLAIVTTVFLPANLIAAIFGMNVAGLPLTHNPSGFAWAMRVARRRLGTRVLAAEAVGNSRALAPLMASCTARRSWRATRPGANAFSTNSARKIAGLTTRRCRRSTP